MFLTTIAITLLSTSFSLAADNWVLHVPSGKEAALNVAKLHHLDNLGEVIPDSNLFHFKQSSRRQKRSLRDLKSLFNANPDISSHEVQDQVLSRSKRVPIPEPPNEIPRASASSGNQLCFVNTISTEEKDSKRCIFPFSYSGKTYVDCTSDHSSNEAEWCATEVKSNGDVVTGQWGDCDKKSLTCLTIGAGSLGQSPAPKRPAPRPATPRVNAPRPAAQPRRPPPPPPRRPPPQQRPLPQQRPPPQQQPPASNEVSQAAGQRLCFINTISDEGKDPKVCIFPFTFRGKTYSKCTADHSANEVEWCATEVKPDGEVIDGQWGDCDKESLTCVIIGGPDGAPKRPPPQQQRPPQNFQGLPPGFPPQGFPPRRPPPSGNGQNRPPPRIPSGPPPRSFPQSGPPRNNSPSPQPKSALPQQFRFDPNNILALALSGKISGIPGGSGTPGSQKPEETFEFSEELRNSLKTFWDDEAWPAMWYLNRGGKGMDMNVEDAWAQGVSGKGVVVTILDDGVEHNHPDLSENYDKEASIDLNDNDDDPFPRYDFQNSNKHGTRCAGTVASRANNSDCAVGIAHNAKIGGVRILDGNILDVLEARAISFNRDHIDIYSASWGPDDDGRTVDGPGPLAKRALEDGAKKGRQGKGSIYVWASGNGGKHIDNCNCDGYTTSIYTLSVSSVSEFGNIPWYSEPCSSSLTTTYSSGSSKQLGERKVVTTDLHGRCTKSHTGTSASSPMAAGIVALALEANPELTWRDVQHIIVRTSIPRGNLKARDWASNAVGLEFSHSYGFGLMDAGAMVRLAKTWKPVPIQHICTTDPGQSGVNSLVIKGQSEIKINLDASNCDRVKFLEHLHLHIDLTSGAKRGDLSVVLQSPSGTTSTLLAPRPFDEFRTGFSLFKAWPMMSVHFWGESVKNPDLGGEWTLIIGNNGDKPCVLNDWQLSFYGTAFDPQPDVALRPDLAPETEILDDDPEVVEAEQPQINVDELDIQSNVELFGDYIQEVEEVTTPSEEN